MNIKSTPAVKATILRLTALFLALLVTLAMLIYTGQAAAQQEPLSDLQMQAQAAFEGNFKYGEWLPIWIELENNGPDLPEAEVRVQVEGGTGKTLFVSPVDLPSVSRKRFPLYVLPNNFSRQLEVQLVSGDELLASQRVAVKAQSNITYMIGLIAEERAPFAQIQSARLPGAKRPIVMAELGLEELPERMEALRSFDAIILNEVDSSTLTAEQGAALEAWVRQGGRLILGGGAQAAATLSGLPAALRPLQLDSDVQLETVSGLENFAAAEAVRVPGPFLAASGAITEGSRTLVEQERLPLLIETNLGGGEVNFSALDLAASPFDAWAGASLFWQTLLSPGAAYPDWLPPDISPRQERASQMPYMLSNLPVLDLPSIQGLALLLGIYILLIGPVNYLVLRGIKKLHLAWITIPVMTALFTAGTFGLGYALRGNDLLLHKIAIVALQPDRGAQVTSYLGLFSPGNQSYEIEVPGNGLISPINQSYGPWDMPPGAPGAANANANQMAFVQGDPSRVRGLSVNQWSMQSFMTEAYLPDFGQISAELYLTEDGLAGTLHNDSDYLIKDALVLLGRGFVRLGDLAPGAQVDLELNLVDFTSDPQRFGPPLSYLIFQDAFEKAGPNGPERWVESHRMLIESVIERGARPLTSSVSRPSVGGSLTLQAPVFLGWLEEVPPSVQVQGYDINTVTTAMVYTQLSYQLPQQGPVSLPPGLVSGSLIEYPRDGGPCGDTSNLGVYMGGNGEATFEFELPGDVSQMSIQELKLSLGSDGGWWSAPAVALYDWQSADWRPLDKVTSGLNRIQDVDGLVDDGRVQLRLSSEGSSPGCYYLAMGLEAARQEGAAQ